VTSHFDPATSTSAGRSCSVGGCGRPHYGHGYCRAHHARWLRHGDPVAGAPIMTKISGGTSYWTIHKRLKDNRGAASAHACAECCAPAVVWSYDGRDPHEQIDPARGLPYSLDLDHYRPRCRSCHRRATPRRGRAPLDIGRVARLYRSGASSLGIGALLHVSPSTVLAALRAANVLIRDPGRSKRHPGPAPQDQNSNLKKLSSQDNSTSRARTPAPTESATRAQSEEQEQPHNYPKTTTTPRHPDPMVVVARPGGPEGRGPKRSTPRADGGVRRPC
jgi:hypothetical protein